MLVQNLAMLASSPASKEDVMQRPQAWSGRRRRSAYITTDHDYDKDAPQPRQQKKNIKKGVHLREAVIAFAITAIIVIMSKRKKDIIPRKGREGEGRGERRRRGEDRRTSSCILIDSTCDHQEAPKQDNHHGHFLPHSCSHLLSHLSSCVVTAICHQSLRPPPSRPQHSDDCLRLHQASWEASVEHQQQLGHRKHQQHQLHQLILLEHL